MIIGILGKAGSGKDTIGLFIRDLLDRSNIRTKRFAFADGVKDVAACMTNNKRSLFDDQDFKRNSYFSLTDGITYSIDDLPADHNLISIRELLQKIGTEAMQGTFGENIWVNKTFSEINNSHEYFGVKAAMITDVRFEHEYKYLKSVGGITIRVINPNITSSDTHISEIALDDYPADYTIINDWENNPDDVDKQVYELVQQIKRRFRNN
ncbi:MAG: hypothetical protein ACRDCN_03650 [Tannerellaceae bacterium]